MDNNQEIVGTAVDWLTVTAVEGEACVGMQKAAHELVRKLLPEVVMPKKWAAMGYNGLNWGSIKFGIRGSEEAIMIVSGSYAQEALELAKIDPQRVTRIDIQVTVAFKKPEPALAVTLYKALQILHKSSKYGRLLTYISSHTGDTLYVGKRGGSTLLRIYDKSKEYGFAEKGSAWRYELEYRRDAAKQVACRVKEADCRITYIISQMLAELQKRKIKSSFPQGSKIDAIEVRTKVTTSQTKLDWLGRCVSPVVVRLLNLGLEEQVLRSLKLNNFSRRQ